MNKQKTNSPIFCLRLKQARLAAGLSQEALGVAAGLDDFTASARMNRYETGIRTPDHLTTANIAKALGIPLPFLYAETDEMAKHILNFDSPKLKSYDNLIKQLNEESFNN
jgi:transcriptional regulator with XRE-family HTH domain